MKLLLFSSILILFACANTNETVLAASAGKIVSIHFKCPARTLTFGCYTASASKNGIYKEMILCESSCNSSQVGR